MSWHRIAAGKYTLGRYTVRRWNGEWLVDGPLIVSVPFQTFREAKAFVEDDLRVRRVKS